jgi:hypothetical protein
MQFDMPGGETGEEVEGKEAGEREWRMGGRGRWEGLKRMTSGSRMWVVGIGEKYKG